MNQDQTIALLEDSIEQLELRINEMSRLIGRFQRAFPHVDESFDNKVAAYRSGWDDEVRKDNILRENMLRTMKSLEPKDLQPCVNGLEAAINDFGHAINHLNCNYAYKYEVRTWYQQRAS